MGTYPQYQAVYSCQPMLTYLGATINIGAAGAPTIAIANGVQSITRLSAGRYQVFMTKPYTQYLSSQVTFRVTSGTSGIVSTEVVGDPTAGLRTIASPNIVIHTLNAAGAETDPASGSVMHLTLYTTSSSAT